MKYKCPICKKPVKQPDPKADPKTEFFPFCSQRCRLVDLGSWLDAEYKIPSQQPGEEAGNDFED